MRRRERLSDLQRNVGRYLLARIDNDGTCTFDGEDLRAQVENEYPYNVFRQFIVKGLIDELPAKRSDGLWELRIADPSRFRRAIGAGRVSKSRPPRNGVDSQDSYYPGCAPLKPPLTTSPEPFGLEGRPVPNVSCSPGIGYVELAFESAMAAMDAEILRIVLADDFTEEDEEALKQLIRARRSASCVDEAAASAYVLAASPPIVTETRGRSCGGYGFI